MVPDTSDVKLWVDGKVYNCTPIQVSGYTNVYGVTVPGDLHLKEYYYLIRGVKVRDPYGVMINNSNQNNVVINMALTEPDGGWAPRSPLVNREDAVIYEVHIRDFTIDPNSGVDPKTR